MLTVTVSVYETPPTGCPRVNYVVSMTVLSADSY